MELCFIWIENYKGFINQGFNFDTENNYNYSISDNTVQKSKNEYYIKNLFSPEITNITGIIGKNASGKTNILELIQYVSDGANTILNKPFFAIYKSEQEFIIYNFKMPAIKNNFDAENKSYDGRIPETDTIYFSNVFDGRRHNFGKKTINISTNDLLISQFGENVTKNYQKTIQQQIKFIKDPKFELLEDVERFMHPGQKVSSLKPTTVVLTSPIWSNIIGRIRNFDERFERATERKVNFKSFALNFKRKITDNNSANSIKYLTAFLVYVDFMLNRDILIFSGNKVFKEKSDYFDMVYSLLKITQDDSRIDEIYKFLTTDFPKIIDSYWNVPETHKFLIDLPEFKIINEKNEEFKESLGSYSNRRIQFTLNYNTEVGNFLTKYLDATTNQSLSYSIDWGGISSGHKAYINLFASFFARKSQIKEDNVLIAIDEGDLYFHPKWQTQFLSKLIIILPKLINKKCQLFLTTHSPFLISDLPKNNLLFVAKDYNDKLYVIPNEKMIEVKTFGGNIGELYLDAFFMEGSLVSSFAERKIREIIDKINNKQESISKEDRILISEIGDELLRTQLQNLIK